MSWKPLSDSSKFRAGGLLRPNPKRRPSPEMEHAAMMHRSWLSDAGRCKTHEAAGAARKQAALYGQVCGLPISPTGPKIRNRP